MSSLTNFIDYSDGVVLLLIAICGNFIAETLNCKLQYLLTHSRAVKYLVVYFTILLTVNLTGSDLLHPLYAAYASFVIWVMFLMFTRMTPVPTLVVVLAVFLTYTVHKLMKYKKSHHGPHSITPEQERQYQRTQTILLSTALIALVVGNVWYYVEKREEYGSSFDFMTYIFGVETCKHLKN